ncbi:MAG: hypothetical protein HQM10_15375 [Candidatus Riflebacteria bacterium]|nr:hypothetical protein [Candidatus Riflebacteria bacterium]
MRQIQKGYVFISIFIFAFVFVSCQNLQASVKDDWLGRTIYFVLIDRFHNGSTINDKNVNPMSDSGFHGGDVAGIISKLDYLKDLGISALWVSPIFKNKPDEFFGNWAYHGYWTYDFFSSDDRFGNLDELKNFRKVLKKDDIKLLLDVPVNHLGYDAPFAEKFPAMFHQTPEIKDWNNLEQVETYKLFGLPDFASEKKIVQLFFQAVARFWITQLSPDGFRLDAVRHVPLDFWKNFVNFGKQFPDKDLFMLGELLDGDPKNISKTLKIGEFTSLFDYPLYYTLVSVIAQNGDCRQLALRFYQDFRYPDSELIASFIDNHDTDRFLTSSGENLKKLQIALGIILTARGIPTLCYGDETGMSGKAEKSFSNRSDMNFSGNSQIREFVKILVHARRKYEALREGNQATLFADDETFSFIRVTSDALAFVAVNRGEKTHHLEIQFPPELPDKILLKDIFSQKTVSVESRMLQISVPPESVCVYHTEQPSGKAFENYSKKIRRSKVDLNEFGTVKVRFELEKTNIASDSQIFVIGGLPHISDWNPDNLRNPLVLLKKGIFSAEVELPARAFVEYKFLEKKVDGNINWMQGENFFLATPDNGNIIKKHTWQ